MDRELSSLLCDDLEDWGGYEGGSIGRGYICLLIADSWWCTAETNTHCKAITLQSKKM